jgi:hypothetical protein
MPAEFLVASFSKERHSQAVTWLWRTERNPIAAMVTTPSGN